MVMQHKLHDANLLRLKHRSARLGHVVCDIIILMRRGHGQYMHRCIMSMACCPGVGGKPVVMSQTKGVKMVLRVHLL